MAEWRIVVPVIDRRQADGFLASIHRPLRHLCWVFDNTKSGYKTGASQHVKVFRFGHNLGVARSWNAAVALARQQQVEWLLFCSASIRFGEESRARDIELLVDLAAERKLWGVAPAPTYWHTALLSVRLFDEIGLMDENFYPAYYEDCDLQRRAALAGCEVPDDASIREATIDAYSLRDGHGVDALRFAHPAEPTINYEALGAYYEAKWGGHVNDRYDLASGFQHPFNDPSKPLSFWEPATVPELLERYGIVGH